MRRVQNNMATIYEQLSNREMNRLPGFIQSCFIACLPETGHCLIVTPWTRDGQHFDPQQMCFEGFEFKCLYEGQIHYKTDICRGLQLLFAIILLVSQ